MVVPCVNNIKPVVETAGFSGHEGGTPIPTWLSIKDESGGCSGRVEGSASCCMMYHVGVTNVVSAAVVVGI